VVQIYTEWERPLSACRLFAGVDTEDLNTMLQCLNPAVRSYEKDEYLTVQGDDLHGVGVLLDGEAIVVKDNVAGQRMIMTVLGEGDIFGETAAFSGEEKWPASVIAQEDCKALFLPPGKITGNCQRQCPSHRRLISNMLRIVSDKALALNKKVEYLSIKSMRGKISAFLFEQYEKQGSTTFMLPLKRNEMAEFLNVARPSLSREMCRMRAEGIIDFHKASIKIKNLVALRSMIDYP